MRAHHQALVLVIFFINRAVVSDLVTCLDAEAVNMVATMSTADHREATAAFIEKREAKFIGR